MIFSRIALSKAQFGAVGNTKNNGGSHAALPQAAPMIERARPHAIPGNFLFAAEDLPHAAIAGERPPRASSFCEGNRPRKSTEDVFIFDKHSCAPHWRQFAAARLALPESQC